MKPPPVRRLHSYSLQPKEQSRPATTSSAYRPSVSAPWLTSRQSPSRSTPQLRSMIQAQLSRTQGPSSRKGPEDDFLLSDEQKAQLAEETARARKEEEAAAQHGAQQEEGGESGSGDASESDPIQAQIDDTLAVVESIVHESEKTHESGTQKDESEAGVFRTRT